MVTASADVAPELEAEEDDVSIPLPPTQALGLRHSRTNVRVMSPLQ